MQILQGHLDTVNSLAVTSDNRLLFSASNDCTIKVWHVGDPSWKQQDSSSREDAAGGGGGGSLSKQQQHHHHHHKGGPMQQQQEAAAAAAPRTPSALRISSSIQTLYAHHDYVKVLAYAEQTHVLASAGLDKRVLLWDIETLVERAEFAHASSSSSLQSALSTGRSSGSRSQTKPKGTSSHGGSSRYEKITGTSQMYTGVEGGGHRDSIYCAAISSEGNLVASGSSTPEMVIRCWDARSGKRVCKLQRHQDTIRSMVMSRDGKYIISAGSDRAMLLWDVGQQRCVREWRTLHQDSIWSLCVDPNFLVVCSGGRDHSVLRTEISVCGGSSRTTTTSSSSSSSSSSSVHARPESRRVCYEAHPVLSCAFQPCKSEKQVSCAAGWVWVSGTSGDIRRWPVHSLEEDSVPFGSHRIHHTHRQDRCLCQRHHRDASAKSGPAEDCRQGEEAPRRRKESADAKTSLLASTAPPKAAKTQKTGANGKHDGEEVLPTASGMLRVTSSRGGGGGGGAASSRPRGEEAATPHGHGGLRVLPLAGGGGGGQVGVSSPHVAYVATMVMDPHAPPPLAVLPDVELQGLPAVVKYVSLHDHRHVLTQEDREPRLLKLWDVTRGIVVASFPNNNSSGGGIERTAEVLCAMALPGLFCCKWYSIDLRLGVLTLQLHKAGVFRGELFASDALVSPFACPLPSQQAASPSSSSSSSSSSITAVERAGDRGDVGGAAASSRSQLQPPRGGGGGGVGGGDQEDRALFEQEEERNATSTSTSCTTRCECRATTTTSKQDIRDHDMFKTADGEEKKINMGEHMLRALFWWWVKRRYESLVNAKDETKTHKLPHDSSSQVVEHVAESMSSKPPLFRLPDATVVLVTETELSSGEDTPSKEYVLSRNCISDFSGNEDERDLPSWVIDCLWKGEQSGGGEALKIHFDLVPDSSFGVFQGQSHKLTAPAVIRIEKLISYVAYRWQVQRLSSCLFVCCVKRTS